MKGYFIKILRYLTVFLLLTTAIQLSISFYIRHRSINGHDTLHLTKNLNADLVFLGSSRCRAHFDPVFFDTTYHLKSANLGIDGHADIAMATLRLKRYLTNNKAPRFLILNFDPLVNGGSATDNTNFVHKNDFARYAFFPSAANRPMVSYFHFNVLEQYVPLYAILKYQLFSSCLSPKGFPYSEDFYDKHVTAIDKEYRTTTDSLRLRRPDARSLEQTKFALAQFKALCAESKIQLICIQTPVYKLIYDSGAFSSPREICSDLGIPFVDANINSIIGDQENFYNADHLNINGVLSMNRFLASQKAFDGILASDPRLSASNKIR